MIKERELPATLRLLVCLPFITFTPIWVSFFFWVNIVYFNQFKLPLLCCEVWREQTEAEERSTGGNWFVCCVCVPVSLLYSLHSAGNFDCITNKSKQNKHHHHQYNCAPNTRFAVFKCNKSAYWLNLINQHGIIAKCFHWERERERE